MVTKNKIKNLIPAGSTLCKSELIEQIQTYTEKYNNGFSNSRHVVIGLFISAGCSHKRAVLSFEKIQEFKNHAPIIIQCHSCGEEWPEDLYNCPNCGEGDPF